MGILLGIPAFISGIIDIKKNNNKLGIYGLILTSIGVLITLNSPGVFSYVSIFYGLFVIILFFIGVLSLTLGLINFKENKKHNLIKIIIGSLIILICLTPYGLILENIGETILTILDKYTGISIF